MDGWMELRGVWFSGVCMYVVGSRCEDSSIHTYILCITYAAMATWGKCSKGPKGTCTKRSSGYVHVYLISWPVQLSAGRNDRPTCLYHAVRMHIPRNDKRRECAPGGLKMGEMQAHAHT